MLSIIVNILLTLLLPSMVSIYINVIIKYIFIALSFTAIYWHKSKKICNNESAKYDKILYDSFISYVLMVILALGLQYMPFFGVVFKIIDKLVPQSRLLLESTAILLIYVVTVGNKLFV